MKKLSFVIAMAALVMFAGCNKDKETQGTTLKASITQNQGDSKTSLDPTNGAINWTTGDKILVSNGGAPVQFTLTNGNGNTNGTFGYAGDFEIGDNTKAVYPSTVNFDGTNISITLPAEQTLADLNQIGTFANSANPMFGEYNGDGITFTSLCGVLGLSLKAENEDEVIPLTAIEIVSNNPNDKLNGTYTCTTDDTELSYTGTDGTNSVKLNCPSGTLLTGTPKEFYIVLPAGALADDSGFTLKLYNGEEEPFFTKERPSALPMQANWVKKMNTLDVTAPSIVTIPEGAINGLFTINANGDQVYFSKGNLQYQASTNTWQFAEHQYDYVGEANSNISETNSGWIDLFGWGTSGRNHGAVCYQPWSISNNGGHYRAYGVGACNLFEQTGQADWGYNCIYNGGNQEDCGWRTLTVEEWSYLLTTRNTDSGIRWAKGIVNNVSGVIIVPDDWNTSNYTLNNVNEGETMYINSNNDISSTEWHEIFEVNGAVFLPDAGWRGFNNETSAMTDYYGDGFYWTSSYAYNYYYSNAYSFYFNNYMLDFQFVSSRCDGCSVRLVRNAE